ncbi:MAG: hypothetical protein FWE50_03695 [Alphaproteobacteria bacterium]|nr:hypothetical protein [Alphaproteobacteria bacterium]
MAGLDKYHIERNTQKDAKLLSYLRPNGSIVGERYLASYQYNKNYDSFNYHLPSGLWHDTITGKEGENIIDLVADSLGIPENYKYYYAMIWLNRYLESDRDFEKAPVMAQFYNSRYGPQKAHDKIFEKYPYYDEKGVLNGYDLHIAPIYGAYIKDGVVVEESLHFPEAYFVPITIDPSTGIPCKHHIPWGRSLYNLPKVIQSENIIVVSDAQIANSASRIWRDVPGKHTVAVTTWSGGRFQVQHSDWSPIQGKNVLIIPRGTEFCEQNTPLEKQPDWRDAREVANILSRSEMKNKVSIVDPRKFRDDFNSNETIHEALKSRHTAKEINDHIRRNTSIFYDGR